MDRRSFLKNTAIGGSAVAASALAAPAYAQGNRTLTMVTSVPDGFAVFDDAAVKFVDLVNSMMDGQITIEKKAAGQLVGAFEVFDAVSSGQADVYHSADYYFGGQHPGYYFFTAVPFGATGGEMTSWYHHGGGKGLHDELGEIFNLKSFMCGNTGHQPGGWFNKEINSAADLQGLKFRMPGIGGLALGRTGASVQNIPGGEIYQALSSGAIDGAEWIGPFADERLGFQEVCEFYYTGGFHEPGSVLSAAFNRDVWNEMTPAQQQICETAAAATHEWSLAQSNYNNGAALNRLQAQGTKIMQFPDDVWDAFGRASKEALDEFTGDELFDRIRASQEEAAAATYAWTSISDNVFQQQRARFNAL
ncbi:ABC transporter substrate-binding protein [Loktanella sp. 5RATIMAR09]|uniref:TRAP transporter substrate-binding protein n=1 Tax=Loktanella sp. 5RATIMAR09 TaxID=1225655 RepID=UPI0006EBD6C1|nr:twin-arginine translocation signal domain-containing protein [Loktanella sp. 5RATIMAR09]KQI72678.1 ABC transporter substrate-binding protein [Loktanella sp. 5RATIMAR09]